MTELALDGPPPPPAASFGGADSTHVLTIGSASKVFWGGLRVGWIRASPPLVRRLGAARAALDLGGPASSSSSWASCSPTSTRSSRNGGSSSSRPASTCSTGSARCSRRGGRRGPTGGLSLWIELGAPVSSRLAMAARRHEVLLAAGPRFGVDGAFERYLRLPYTVRRDRAETALERLALAWRDLDRTARAHRGRPRRRRLTP